MQAMDITPLGHASFKLRGKSVTVITDPYDSDSVGLKFPKNLEAQIVTVSHQHEDHNNTAQIGGNPYIVGGPGEYEIAGVRIEGLSTFHDAEKGASRGRNTVYYIQLDKLNILHVGDLGHALSAGEIERIGDIDILFVPVGGVYTITAKQAADLVHEIEPSVVIPMHYQREGLNPKSFSELSPVTEFLKEMGKEGVVPQNKFSVTKDKLPEEMQIIVLE